MRIALYVSGHGFGHATRQAALMETLSARGGCEILLRTEAPVSIFKETGVHFEHRRGAFDVGMIQHSALCVDMPSTLKAHQGIFSDFDGIVSRERAVLTHFAPDVVLSDCGAAPIEAAHSLKIPAFVIGSFTWDWILEEYEKEDPRWSPIVRRYRKAYALANAYWRLPFHGGNGDAFSSIIDFPHLVRRPQLERSETLSALGLPKNETRNIVTVGFGGFETAGFTGAEPDSMSGYVFVGFTPPPPGFKAQWIQLPKHSPVRTVDLARISSVLIGKLGYGTVAECLVYGVRMLYVPRPGIREIPFIEQAVRFSGGTRKLHADDFFDGRWQAKLDRVMEDPHPAFTLGDGAEKIADALLTPAETR